MGDAGAPWVCVAVVSGAHGVRGEARIKAFTEDPAALERFGQVHLSAGGRPTRVKLMRPVKGGWAARLDGVESREAAQALAGTELCVPRTALGEAAEEEYFLADLRGLAAVDLAGARLGTVRDVVDFGAGDLVELALDKPAAGLGRTVMLPFTRRFVPQVDVAGGRVMVDLAAWLAEQAETDGR